MVVPRRRKRQRKAKLPEEWRRIGRPEWERHPKLLSGARAARKMIVEGDLKGDWHDFRTPLGKVEWELGVSISDIVRTKIRKGAYSTAKPVRVLDLGCGAGTALQALKDKFKERIRTVGLVMEKTPGEKYAGVDRLVVGEINEARVRERFDVIYCRTGATTYTWLGATALERVIRWLKPGGRAALEINPYLKKNVMPEMRSILMVNGIRKYEFRETDAGTILLFEKPAKRLP